MPSKERYLEKSDDSIAQCFGLLALPVEGLTKVIF